MEDDDTGEEEGVTAGVGGVAGEVGRAGIQGTGRRWWLQWIRREDALRGGGRRSRAHAGWSELL